MEERDIISVSRTKDIVRVSPQKFAEILQGEAPARFGLGKKLHLLSLGYPGALVIWTKDPKNMLSYPPLREVLDRYVGDFGGLILLNLTVTGLGGTALEPGIASSEEVYDATAALIDKKLVRPEAIILRYDPLIQISTRSGSLGNITLEAFDRILDMFCPMGIERVKTSLVDARYAHVPKRFDKVGFTLDLPSLKVIDNFYEEIKKRCRLYGAQLDICCSPKSLVTGETRGCIDGHLINRLLDKAGTSWRVTTTPHNDIGRQRPTCKCTYSRDIGYSDGFQTCFKHHGACIYCYSQRNMKGAAIDKASALANEADPMRRLSK